MSTPASVDARLFYRFAFQRHEEAEFLLEGGYTTGAVYLAGYGVECILKALILMAIKIPRGRSDKTIKSFMVALDKYQADHPKSKIDIYRQNAVSIRVRIIDPDFKKLSRVERHQNVWDYFAGVPEDDQSDISMLLLLTPEEATRSAGNVEFEDPVPSLL